MLLLRTDFPSHPDERNLILNCTELEHTDCDGIKKPSAAHTEVRYLQYNQRCGHEEIRLHDVPTDNIRLGEK